MKPRSRNILTGFVTIIALLGLAWLIHVFGEVPAWVSGHYPVQVRLADATGLGPGSRIHLNGLDIGSIETIRLMDDPSQGVSAVARIRPPYRIPTRCEVRVISSVFGGSARLEISIPPPPAEQTPATTKSYLPTDGSAVLHADTESFTQRLEQSFDKRFTKFDKIAEQISKLSDEYLEVGRRVNALLEQRSPEQVDAGQGPANLTTVLARADQDLAEFRKTIDAINKLVDDKQLRDDIRAAAANTRKLTESADKRLAQLTERYVALADDLGKTIKQADGLITEARAGEGTLGKLISDPKLYDSLTDAADRLSDALTEAKLLIEKWKAEGVPIQY